jgi:hypothetical protein
MRPIASDNAFVFRPYFVIDNIDVIESRHLAQRTLTAKDES